MMPIDLKVVIEQEIPGCWSSAQLRHADRRRRVRILVQNRRPWTWLPRGLRGTTPSPAAAQPSSRTSGSHGSAARAAAARGAIPGGKGEFVYNEELADPVYPPVPVEVQGIIYIYNPPKIQIGLRRPATLAVKPLRQPRTDCPPAAVTPPVAGTPHRAGRPWPAR